MSVDRRKSSVDVIEHLLSGVHEYAFERRPISNRLDGREGPGQLVAPFGRSPYQTRRPDFVQVTSFGDRAL